MTVDHASDGIRVNAVCPGLTITDERVAREQRSVYTLTYRPSDQDFDGKWRRVRVRTKRKGISVRTRPGHYAY